MNDTAYSVFKALADPTRRRLLDMLQIGAQTTGDLAAALADDMSRYGVMKHLDVLEHAGLVVVRRQGRKRYNHLNAVPIQEIYQRWVGKYAGATAASLIHLKELAETEDTDMSIEKNEAGKNIDSFHIAQEIVIEAPRDKVWKALTDDIGKWWAFRTIEQGKGEMTLQATVGGHFIESHGDSGAVWGTVVFLRQGEKLQLNGALGLTSRPVNSQYTYELEERKGATLLKLTHQCIGHNLEDTGDKYSQGWQALLGKYLKGYVEDGKTCGDIDAEPPAANEC